MADQFGYQTAELQKIQRDFRTLAERMAKMTEQVGHIKQVVATAAAADVWSSQFSGILGFASVVTDVVQSVKAVESKADHLQATKEELTKGLAQDLEKIQRVIAEYQAAEKRIAEEVGGQHQGQEKPKPPQTGIDSAGGNHGGGSHGGGDGGGGGNHGGGGQHQTPQSPNHGGHDTSGNDGSGVTLRPGGRHDGPKIKDRSTGEWNTHINGRNWEDWPANSHSHPHPTNGHGAGVLAKPNLDGVSDERRAMVDRAMERVERKLGYSQGAITNGYRVDCSGFVSAAWGLNPAGGGTSTGPLISESAGIAHHISKGSMEPGDALVVHHTSGDHNQHVVLFGGWADKDHTKMIILEDSGSRGCVSREVSLSAFSEYTAIRKNGM
ncbi:hypothetical protein [Kitasatospora terrestris]|uniref:NlpC/P60 domain-containing protein n=1 Tax=Kitasatospora terrestris TaxID=258051 RepID=A0ABP9DT31_9ACTN